MKFNTEVELVELLKSKINLLSEANYVKISEEVGLGHGIADLVISESSNKNKFNVHSKILSERDINIYKLIASKKELTQQNINLITKLKSSQIQKSIEALLDQKYIRVENEVISINRQYETWFDRNFAIEAKLKNWKRALQQAYRYKWFAEYSYVVLDSYYSKPAVKNIEEFKKMNIGLATLNTNGELKTFYTPKYEKPIDHRMQILFAEKTRTQL